MRILTPLVLTGVLLGGATIKAQERPPERPPETEALPAPRPVVEPPPIGVRAESGCPNLKILWFDHFKPVSVLDPVEVITEERVKSLDVVYKTKKHTVEEIVIKSREVQEPYDCTTYVPVQVTDPHTGHCSTVLQPHTETKMRTVTLWYAEPVKREIEIEVPYLDVVEDVLYHRSILLEYRTELQRHGGAMKIEAGENKPPLYLHTPPHDCPTPH